MDPDPENPQLIDWNRLNFMTSPHNHLKGSPKKKKKRKDPPAMFL